ncbi:GNAT family N-acetyltransferase [Neobacillus sp. YIM B06451]|uniref:GNAT family N-acetyltransferase n=1 Tax=Neobacillus sp. YIM B06451 TaxID=3070994 RepID=UPI002931BF8F|nr:GNAT family N-acetyltransferase [Neobacillus sp. YIM B06451]
MDITIRKATVEDAEAIAKVHVESWQTTYKGIMDEGFLQRLSVEKRKELWLNNIPRVESIVLVAELGGEIVGFADGSPVKEGEYPGYDGDVTSIYFYEKHQGKGFGKQLLNQLLDEFRQQGFTSAIVKVLEDNAACRFYEALGARRLDENVIEVAGGKAKLLTYAWDKL